MYADEGLIAEANAQGNVTKTYGYIPGSDWGTMPVWMNVHPSTSSAETPGYHWFMNDRLGTPQKLTAPNGAVTWSATSSAFGGTVVDPASTVENNLRFPGQYFDAETGLHYSWYRYYDPANGRFISEDPYGSQLIMSSIVMWNTLGKYGWQKPKGPNPFIGSDSNSYRYVWNRPTGFIDHAGLWGVGIEGGAQGEGGVGAAGAGAQGQVGGGFFSSGFFNNPNVGAFASGGALAGSPWGGYGNPSGKGSALGGSVGFGASGFVTNATCVGQLAGPFTTVSVNVGVGPFKFSAQYAYSGGIWMLSFGPPFGGGTWGLSGSVYQTNTVVLGQRNLRP
jgi:RHS repeat-associated protein